MRLEGNKIAYERWTYDFPVLLELLERANLEQDLRLAAEVQNALLPRTRRVGTYFEVVGASLACRAIGGDFFEYIDLPCDRFAFALGDVAGMGVSAALLASMVQGIMATEAATNSGPADVLSHVNGALLRRELESRFATAFYAVLTPEGGLTYCNGGHNPPFLLSDHETRRLVEGAVS